MHLIVGHPKKVTHELVRFADELHIAVLNAVMHHLDEVSCAILADPVAARRAVLDLGADGLKNGLHILPRGGTAAGHHAGTF